MKIAPPQPLPPF